MCKEGGILKFWKVGIVCSPLRTPTGRIPREAGLHERDSVPHHQPGHTRAGILTEEPAGRAPGGSWSNKVMLARNITDRGISGQAKGRATAGQGQMAAWVTVLTHLVAHSEHMVPA